MKTAIFTLTIGDSSGFIPCLLSARNYARRHGISYFVSTRLDIRLYAACFEKFQDFKLFDKGFDHILSFAPEGSVEAFQSWSRECDLFITASPTVTKSSKTCSIVFPGTEDPVAVNQYLRSLPADEERNFVIVRRQPFLDAGGSAYL